MNKTLVLVSQCQDPVRLLVANAEKTGIRKYEYLNLVIRLWLAKRRNRATDTDNLIRVFFAKDLKPDRIARLSELVELAASELDFSPDDVIDYSRYDWVQPKEIKLTMDTLICVLDVKEDALE
jgi:hypothetical protein